MKAILSFALLGLAFSKSGGHDHDSAFMHGNFRVETYQKPHGKPMHHGSHHQRILYQTPSFGHVQHGSHQKMLHQNPTFAHIQQGSHHHEKPRDLGVGHSHRKQKMVEADEEFMFLGKNGDFPRKNQQVMEHFRKAHQVAHDDFEGNEFFNLFNLFKPFQHKHKHHKETNPQTPAQKPEKTDVQSLVKTDAEELYIEDDFLCCRKEGNPLHNSVSCIKFEDMDDDDFVILSKLIKEAKGSH